MKIYATTSEQVLEAVLYHLHATGWPIVDVDKLAGVYDAFQSQTGRLLYGSVLNADLALIKECLETDIAGLEARQLAQKTVSRVQLTIIALPTAAMLKVDMRFTSLLDLASAAFPPKA